VANDSKPMRHSILIAFTFLFISCNQSPSKDSMVVSGQIKGLKKGTLYLQHIPDSTLVTIDSIEIDGSGNFKFDTKIKSPEVFYLYLNKKDNNIINDRITFFGAPGVIEINTKWNTFDSDPVIRGTSTNDTFMEYTEMMSRFNIQDMKLMEKAVKASNENNQVVLDSLQKAADNNALRRYLFVLNFALNNSDSYVAPYVTLNDAPNANVKFLDSIYNKLTPEVATSKYGKELELFIEEIKSNN
jgi:hypothetical protein